MDIYQQVAERMFWAHRMAELRLRRDVPFEELAERSLRLGGRKLTLGQISEYEKGNVRPKLGALVAIARALTYPEANLRVDPGWLAFGDESLAPNPGAEAATHGDTPTHGSTRPVAEVPVVPEPTGQRKQAG
jgi:transcriptional regulator with XRE-family HTH domain